MTENQHSREAVNRLARSLVEAWNRHDASAFAASFAEDAEFTNVFGMRARGRADVERFHAPIFSTMFRDSTLSATRVEMRFLRPDIATVDLAWEMTGARNPMGEEWPRRRGLINLVASSDAGRWQIDVMHNMDLPDEDMALAQKAIQNG